MKCVEITTVRIRINLAWLIDIKTRTKLFFQRRWPRYSLAAVVSLTAHLFVAMAYWLVSALSMPPVLELREITFLDLSEGVEEFDGSISEPVIHPAREKEVEPEKPKPPSPKRNAQPRPETPPPPKMDMIRRQAPISLASHSPIVPDQPVASDVIKLSPAKGLQNDKMVQSVGARISLNPQNRLKIPREASVKAPVKQREPQIVLNAEKLIDKFVPSRDQQEPVLPIQEKSGPILAARQSSVSITGPLSKRKILQKSIPQFPRWAKVRGVGASISLQFTVMNDGQVKENIVVIRTSGSKEWDDAVVSALRTWSFVALPLQSGRNDQTGTITFQFVID